MTPKQGKEKPEATCLICGNQVHINEHGYSITKLGCDAAKGANCDWDNKGIIIH